MIEKRMRCLATYRLQFKEQLQEEVMKQDCWPVLQL